MTIRYVRRNFKVNGVLVDPTSIVLCDSAATYGVKRNDTDAVVVAANTPMTKVAVGIYEYGFTEPEDGLEYTAWVKIVYGGNTYYFEHDLAVTESTTTTTTTTAAASSDGVANLSSLLAAPLATKTDEGFVRERTVDELIKADAYLKGLGAGDAVPWGLRVAKTMPPGTVSDDAIE